MISRALYYTKKHHVQFIQYKLVYCDKVPENQIVLFVYALPLVPLFAQTLWFAVHTMK
jgi:hypothetical protein